MSVTVRAPQDRQLPLQKAAAPLELSAEQLHFRPALTLDFQTTKELEPPHKGRFFYQAAIGAGLPHTLLPFR
jgi:hypothetical protein